MNFDMLRPPHGQVDTRLAPRGVVNFTALAVVTTMLPRQASGCQIDGTAPQGLEAPRPRRVEAAPAAQDAAR